VQLVFVEKIKIFVTEYLSDYKNSILKYFTTHLGVYCVVSVTLNNNGEEVFYIEHISVQLVLINVYSYDGLCASFENKIPF